MVSRVNLISNLFSYCPVIPSNTTGAVRHNNFFDVVKKFLVTGGDPLNIESITIVDNVVRVVTIEKNFYSVPGAKLVISGTGVSALDDRHEIEEVFSDGFSFIVETPNAVYTNGLTYKFPSLGWSLLDQDADRMLLRSGANTSQFNIVIRKNVNDNGNTNKIMHWYFVNKNATRLNEVFIEYPGLLNSSSMFYLPIRYQNVYENSINNYFFYGDEGCIYLAGGGAGSITTECCGLTFIGEYKTNNEEKILGINGRRSVINSTGNHLNPENDFSNNRAVSAFTSNGGEGIAMDLIERRPYYIGFIYKQIDNFRLSGEESFSASVPSTHVSGEKSSSYSPYKTEKKYLPVYIYDSFFHEVATAPGIRYIDFNSNLIAPKGGKMTAVKNVINKANRKCCIINFATTYIGIKNSSNSNRSSCAMHFDLTGPIR